MAQPQHKIAVIGLGYVGLPVLIAIANKTKFDVIGYDINQSVIADLKNGKCPVKDELVAEDLSKSKKLSVTNNPGDIEGRDIFIVCVPTPVNEDKEPDYGPVISAAKLAGKYIKKGNILVLESTVNPGTCEEIVAPVVEDESGLKFAKDFDVVHCPERINPGDPKWNIYTLPRVIGGSRPEATDTIKDIYSQFIGAKLKLVSSLKVAESAKILENSFRDVNIAFINELAKSFDAMGVDLIETIHAASTKPMGFMPFWPGPGVGGHCIAVDPYYLIRRAAKFGFNHRFLKEARMINDSMPDYVIYKLTLMLNRLGKSIKGTKITQLGLSYKPDIGDLRESPALEVRKKLEELGADLIVFDPFFSDLSTVDSLEKSLENCEAVVITTNHKEFLGLTSKELVKHGIKAVLDTRNSLNKADFHVSTSVIYSGIGS